MVVPIPRGSRGAAGGGRGENRTDFGATPADLGERNTGVSKRFPSREGAPGLVEKTKAIFGMTRGAQITRTTNLHNGT